MISHRGVTAYTREGEFRQRLSSATRSYGIWADNGVTFISAEIKKMVVAEEVIVAGGKVAGPTGSGAGAAMEVDA